MPAELPEKVTRKIQDDALKIYKAVGCRHYGRVDFRLNKKNEHYFLLKTYVILHFKDVFTCVSAVLLDWQSITLRLWKHWQLLSMGRLWRDGTTGLSRIRMLLQRSLSCHNYWCAYFSLFSSQV